MLTYNKSYDVNGGLLKGFLALPSSIQIKSLNAVSGIVYTIKNLIVPKIYIGESQTSFAKRYPNGWWQAPHMCNSKLRIDAKKYGIENFRVDIYTSTDIKKDEQNVINYFKNQKVYTLYNGTKKNANYGPKRGQKKRLENGVVTQFQTAGITLTDTMLKLITPTSCGKTKDGHAAKSNAKRSFYILSTTGVVPTAAKLALVTSVIKNVIVDLPSYGYNATSVKIIGNNLTRLIPGIARNI